MRLTLKTTLIALLTLLVAALAGEGVLALHRIRLVNASTVDISTNWLPSIRALGELKYALTRLRLVDARFVVANEPIAELVSVAEKRLATLRDAMQTYEPLISSAEEGEIWKDVRRNLDAYQADRTSLEAAAGAGDKAALNAVFARSRTPFDALVAAIDRDTALNTRGSDAAVAEAARNFESAVLLTSLTLAVAIAMGAGGILYVIFGVGRPIDRITRAMQAISAGRLDAEIPYARNRNEIGDMAASLATFRDGLAEAERLRAEQKSRESATEAQRRAAARQLADGFEQAVGGIVGMVSASATELQATAGAMTVTATETASQSTTVAAAAEEAASNVNTVAAAAEELGVSVQEIGRQVMGSADLAHRAVSEADRTGALVQELSGAVSRIGDVVSLISSIAGQTNLLALNATIEAARAGEAGRGFAVVAAEVKELAGQTARATDEISGQITRIQSATGQAVDAIGAITARIREISGVATSIAAAVEEQGAATQEIVRNVSQASTGTSEVTRNIAGVAQASEETGAAASQVLSSASELSRQSEHLRAEVARFLGTVRAA